MLPRRQILILVGCGILGMPLLSAASAPARDTEEHLRLRIRTEQNAVKKAKLEIKLAQLKLEQAQDAYSQAHVEEGARRVAVVVEEMRSSWKLLRESGRTASRQPEGFRELDIALRESVRALEDLGRTVSFYDRGPLENAAKELDQMRDEVIAALFPGEKNHNRKGPAAPAKAGSSTVVR